VIKKLSQEFFDEYKDHEFVKADSDDEGVMFNRIGLFILFAKNKVWELEGARDSLNEKINLLNEEIHYSQEDRKNYKPKKGSSLEDLF
tara:strand:+ start:319 stop:582 length:264 start_codon:yes stop_codon:yes gene_type:complete